MCAWQRACSRRGRACASAGAAASGSPLRAGVCGSLRAPARTGDSARVRGSASTAGSDENWRWPRGSTCPPDANSACLPAKRARPRRAYPSDARGSAVRSSSRPARCRRDRHTRAACRWAQWTIAAAALAPDPKLTEVSAARRRAAPVATRGRHRPSLVALSDCDLARSSRQRRRASSACAWRRPPPRARPRARSRFRSARLPRALSGARPVPDRGGRSAHTHNAKREAYAPARRSSHDAGRSRCSRPHPVRSSGAGQHTSG